MNVDLDLTDVLPVTADEMRDALRLALLSGMRIQTFQAPTESDLQRMAAVFWRNYSGKTVCGRAIQIRLTCLMHVLTARRLAPFLREHSEALFSVACGLAAEMRLNARWGFNRFKLIAAIDAAMGSYHEERKAILPLVNAA